MPMPAFAPPESWPEEDEVTDLRASAGLVEMADDEVEDAELLVVEDEVEEEEGDEDVEVAAAVALGFCLLCPPLTTK